MADYAHPDVLVSTDWVLEHSGDPSVRVIEVNEDVLLYDTGHAPGSVKIDWLNDLWDDTIREFIQPDELAALEKEVSKDPQAINPPRWRLEEVIKRGVEDVQQQLR